MKRALERHKQKEAIVVPILLRPVLYTGAPFEKLQMLPSNGKPVVKWRHTDDAFYEIARDIERISGNFFGYSERGTESYKAQSYQHRILHESPDRQYSLRLSNEPAWVFLSYSPQDQIIARRLERDLQKRGIDTWLDINRIQSGDDRQDIILAAIRQSLAVLHLASPDSRASKIVRDELEIAKVYRKPIFPVWIAGEKWADIVPIETIYKQYIDIRGEDQYQQGLERLEELVTELPTLAGNVDMLPDTLSQSVQQTPLRARRGLSRSAEFILILILTLVGALVALLNTIYQPLISTMRAARARTRQRHQYYEEVVDVYQIALGRYPRDGYAFQGMGKALSALGRYDSALSAFEQAIAYLPASDKAAVSAAYAGLGGALARLKRNDEAVAAYEQAMALDSTVTFNHNDLIRALFALGKKEEAARIRERARQLGCEDI